MLNSYDCPGDANDSADGGIWFNTDIQDYLNPNDGHGDSWWPTSFCTLIKDIRFTVVAAPKTCPPDNFSSPRQQEYINQYAAGTYLNLPPSYGKKGGNACGPSSFTMLVNSLKKAAGDDQHLLDLKTTYDSTYRPGGFQWEKALDYARSLGYDAVLDEPGARTSSKQPAIVNEPTQAFVDSELAAGNLVLVSTTFGAGKWDTLGGGHVILITGRASTYTQTAGSSRRRALTLAVPSGTTSSTTPPGTTSGP